MANELSYRMRAFEHPAWEIGSYARLKVQYHQWAKRALTAASNRFVSSPTLAGSAAVHEINILRLQTREFMQHDLNPDPVLLLKPTGEVIFMNRAARLLSGLPEEKWLGKNFSEVELIDKDSLAVAATSLARELKGENPPQPEIKIKTVEGEKIVEVRAQVLGRTGKSKPDAVLVTFRDMTARKLAEEKTRASETKFREMFMMMREGVALCELLFDDHGNITDFIFSDINPSYEAQTGMKREAVIGKRLSEAFGITFKQFSDLYKIPALRKEIDETGHATATEVYFDLLKRYFEISIIRQDENRFMLVFSDITERKQAEKLSDEIRNVALRLIEATQLVDVLSITLKSAFAISGMSAGGIYLVDRDGNLDLHYHEGLSDTFIDRISHIPKDSPQAKLAMAGHVIYAAQKDLAADPLASLAAEGLKTILVVPIKKGDNVIGCMNISSYEHAEITQFARNAIVSLASQIGGAIEIKHLAEELSAARTLGIKELRKAAHDFNNIIMVISGSIEVAMTKTQDESARRNLKNASDYIAKMLKITEEILHPAEAVKLSSVAMDVSSVLRSAIMTARQNQTSRTKAEIEFKTSVHRSAGDVHFNKIALEMTIVNLINNAFDAMQTDGKLTVSLSPETIVHSTGTAISGEMMPPGRYVAIRVADTGTGIQNMSDLFTGRSTKGEKGSGVGLTAVRDAVKAHKGYLTVDSRFSGKDSGSTFTIYLPVAN